MTQANEMARWKANDVLGLLTAVANDVDVESVLVIGKIKTATPGQYLFWQQTANIGDGDLALMQLVTLESLLKKCRNMSAPNPPPPEERP